MGSDAQGEQYFNPSESQVASCRSSSCESPVSELGRRSQRRVTVSSVVWCGGRCASGTTTGPGPLRAGSEGAAGTDPGAIPLMVMQSMLGSYQKAAGGGVRPRVHPLSTHVPPLLIPGALRAGLLPSPASADSHHLSPVCKGVWLSSAAWFPCCFSFFEVSLAFAAVAFPLSPLPQVAAGAERGCPTAGGEHDGLQHQLLGYRPLRGLLLWRL